MSRTSKLLLGVVANMMVCWLLIGADELDRAKQEDHAGFGPATRQLMALQSMEARCRAETDAAVVAAVAVVADTAAVAVVADALDVAAKTDGRGGCGGSGRYLARSACPGEDGEIFD